MRQSSRQVEQLLDRTQSGDVAAGVSLLISHRHRLRDSISYRLHRNLARHVDPSDIVQETLVVAAKKLDQYARERPVPFYVWLRRLALDRLAKADRHYLGTQKRNGEPVSLGVLTDDSLHSLAQNVVDTMPTPEDRVIRDEQIALVIQAIQGLPENQASVIELRYLEKMSFNEIAVELQSTAGNVRQLHLRAIHALRELLVESGDSR